MISTRAMETTMKRTVRTAKKICMAETDLSVGRTLALAARGRQTLSGATRGRGGDDGCEVGRVE